MTHRLLISNLLFALTIASFAESPEAIFEKSKDAIVKVHAERQLQIGNLASPPLHNVGTGFFINRDGAILTAATVIEDADTFWIEQRGKRVDAKLLGRCLRTNIAVLKVHHVESPLPLGGAGDLQVGDTVIAIGFPYDLPSTPVVGHVQGLDISRGTRAFPTTHIRATCKLQPGQAGGPLLNERGEVVGIAVASHTDDQCYALPIHAAMKQCKDILADGAPQPAWVGLGVTEKQFALSAEPEVWVQQVYPNSPAAKAGLCDRDVLLRVGTNHVHQLADVLDPMFFSRTGQKVDFTVLRDGETQQVTLIVGKRDPPATPQVKPTFAAPLLVPAAHTP